MRPTTLAPVVQVVLVRRLLVAFALAALSSPHVETAQSGGTQKPAPETPQPVFKSRANFVRVDVYPMRGGTPVQDLSAEDFEIQEDGVKQTVETFEHVVIRPAGPQHERSEPSTIETSKQAAANPRARVFVIFLDVPHVTIDGTWHVREPLIRLIDRILGPDDLVGLMTPGMAASDLVLARKTAVLDAGLRDRWPWGERHTLVLDERARMYERCYGWAPDVMKEMTERQHERATLEALDELVGYLRDIREERKAILTVTEGWLLYTEDESLTHLRVVGPNGQKEPVPTGPPIAVGPGGKLGIKNREPGTGSEMADCDEERLRMSMIDDEKYLREIFGHANRANASFYTIDPRGLAVWDSPVGPGKPPPPAVDQDRLKARLESMRVLAENTDGMAVISSNDLDKSFTRIAADLTSYYLLGYYSTNQKPDGRFHTIKVRVKRPGIDVRARKGYHAATEAEIARATTASAAPVPAILSPIASALGALDRLRPGARLHVNAVPGAAVANAVSTIWVAGELQPIVGEDPWSKGGTAEIDVSGGGVSGTARVALAAGERAFVVPVTLAKPIDAGTIDVRVRLTGTLPSDRATDSTSVDLAASTGRPLLFRRGPSTGNRLQPVAAFQFNRTERARFEMPIGPDVKPGAARLLDKTGQPLPIPVTVGERTGPVARPLQPGDGPLQPGDRWMTVDVTLAPLAPGDYVVELTAQTSRGEQRTIAAIRVIR